MSPATLHRLSLARAVAGSIETPVDRLMDALSLLEEVAADKLNDEAFEADEAEPVLPDVAIVDEHGRPLLGARIDREPGTDRFTIVLTTTAEPEEQP